MSNATSPFGLRGKPVNEYMGRVTMSGVTISTNPDVLPCPSTTFVRTCSA